MIKQVVIIIAVTLSMLGSSLSAGEIVKSINYIAFSHQGDIWKTKEYGFAVNNSSIEAMIAYEDGKHTYAISIHDNSYDEMVGSLSYRYSITEKLGVAARFSYGYTNLKPYRFIPVLEYSFTDKISAFTSVPLYDKKENKSGILAGVTLNLVKW